MLKLSSSLLRTAAAAALVSGLAAAGPLYAAQVSTSQPDSQMDQSSMSGKKSHDMEQRVEQRIQTLHDKLKITPDQEAQWNDVAQVMRDNEANMSQLIEQRHQGAAHMNAIDDLKSYSDIAQAHADGIKKLASAFKSLYDTMSPHQKMNADEVFGRFEGHPGGKSAAHSHTNNQ